MGKADKIGIAVVSMMLVVGCVVGAVLTLRHRDRQDNVPPPSAATKMQEAVCAPTQYKEACITSLNSVANKPDASYKDYLEAVVKATLDEVNKAVEVTNKVVVDKSNDPKSTNQMGVDSCKDFLNQTIRELDAAISEVGKSDIESINKKTHELLAYMTGALIYQATCVDELEKPEYKSQVEAGMKNATQLVSNALSIFANMNGTMGALDGQAGLSNILANDPNKSSRRLLSNTVAGHEVDDSGFPRWVSLADRKLLGAPALAPVGPGVQPNTVVVVATDGSGNFTRVQDAVNAVPDKNTQRFVIHVKAGTYTEHFIMKGKDNVYLVGDGIGKTIITEHQNYGQLGVITSQSATVGVEGNYFMARGITFENTAGPDGHQAVALRINGEHAVLFECEMTGYQDTLYYHKGTQFYKNCIISGTVDFIFGGGRAIIQDSTIIARKPAPNQQNMLTADGGDHPNGVQGLVIQNCHINAEPELLAALNETKTYLGRPWKYLALTVFMQNDIGDFIAPEGYSPFATVGPDANNQLTATYAEYMNTGPGANTDLRDTKTFPKFKVLSPQEAGGYTVRNFIQGPGWLPAAEVPFKPDL